MGHRRQVRFLSSSEDWRWSPKPQLPEFAFVGRSNVGKSSLINMLAGQKALAKVSSMPGRTQLINRFLVDSDCYLVDLPGYGYAELPPAQRARLRAMVEDYLCHGEQLSVVFVLLDVRLAPQAIDLEFLGWLADHAVPTALVYTKCDKLTAHQLQQHVAVYQAQLLELFEQLPPQFQTSAPQRIGGEAIWGCIREVLEGALED